MSFKEFLEEVRDYSGSSRSYTRKNDYINRKKREKLKTGETDDTEDEESVQSSVIKKETNKSEPEYGTTKK